MQEQNKLVATDDDDRWINTVISCARTVNKMFTRNTCRICNVYSDKQLEFEQHLSDVMVSPADRAYLKTSAVGHPEVELYRQFLFDEESVVDQVLQRETETVAEEDHTSVGTQQTQ